MTTQCRGTALSEGLTTLVDDNTAVYALVEDLTKTGFDGTGDAFVAALRTELEAINGVLLTAGPRHAIATAMERACSSAMLVADAAAARHGTHPRSIAILVVLLAADHLFVVRRGPVAVDLLRAGEVIDVTGSKRSGIADGLQVVTVDVVTADTVLLRSSRLTGGLPLHSVRSLSNDLSPEALATLAQDFAAVPGALGPHAIIGVRVNRGCDAATVRQRDALLRTMHLFRGLGERELRLFAPCISLRRWFSGEQLWWDDDPADFLAVVVAGRVGLVGPSGESPIGPGGTIGETSLGGPEQRRAFSAVARSTVDALVLRRDDFEALCARHPTLALSILRQLVAALATRVDATAPADAITRGARVPRRQGPP